MMDNIHLTKAPDVDSLLSLLSFFIPAKIEAINAASLLPPNPSSSSQPPPPLPIKLIILDSIAAPFRVSHSSNSSGFITRSKEFAQVGTQLKALAWAHNLAIVVVNQVSDVFTSALPPSDRETHSSLDAPHRRYNLPDQLYSYQQTPHFSGQSNEFGSMAALGHTWSGIVNTRLMLFRLKRRTEEGDVVRRLEVVFSPGAPRAGIDYVVEQGGIRSLLR